MFSLDVHFAGFPTFFLRKNKILNSFCQLRPRVLPRSRSVSLHTLSIVLTKWLIWSCFRNLFFLHFYVSLCCEIFSYIETTAFFLLCKETVGCWCNTKFNSLGLVTIVANMTLLWGCLTAHGAVGLKNPEGKATWGRGLGNGDNKKRSLGRTCEGQSYTLRQSGAILRDKGEKYFLLPSFF